MPVACASLAPITAAPTPLDAPSVPACGPAQALPLVAPAVPVVVATGAQAAVERLAKKTFHPLTDTVLVVGAGVSAMGFVRTLIRNNVPPSHITVVESASAAGGKVTNVNYEGRVYELGAQVIIPKLYAEIERLRDELGATTRPLTRGTSFEVTKGEIGPVLSAAEAAELKTQIGRYLKMYSELWHQADGRYRLLDPLGLLDPHPSLRVTWPELVKQHGFQMIDKGLATLLTGSTFRDNDHPAPAARIVRALRPELFQTLFAEGNVVQQFNDDGFQGLWRRAAADLERRGVKFRYDTKVERIERDANGPVRLSLSAKAGKVDASADHVMFTGHLPALGDLLADCTPSERAWLSRVVCSDFRSFLVRLDGLEKSQLASIAGKTTSSAIRPHIFGVIKPDGSQTMTVGEPVLMLKPHADANVAIVYVNGDATLSDAQARANITTALGKLGVQATVLDGRAWRYFPRPSGDAQLVDQAVMASQGRGGLWFAGSYFTYESTIGAFENGRDFAQLMVDGNL